jgi:hypothetical protein
VLFFDVYLQGVRFDAYTDHAALVYMVKAQTATNNGRLMRYLMDIQHLDAGAVSRLLKCGEELKYLDADELERDKGLVTEIEALIARDLAERTVRRIRLAEKRAWLKGKAEAEIPEAMLHGLRKDRASTEESSRVLRARLPQVTQKVRMAPGWDNLHDLESPEEAKSMTLAKKCGFNRVAVAKSTIAGGYGLFLSKEPVKARTLLTSYEGETPTKAHKNFSRTTRCG